MSDLTGITIPARPLRKNTIQKYVPDTAPPPSTSTSTATPYTAGGAFRMGTVKVAPTSTSGGGHYIAGTNQWGEPTVMYFPATTTIQKIG